MALVYENRSDAQGPVRVFTIRQSLVELIKMNEMARLAHRLGDQAEAALVNEPDVKTHEPPLYVACWYGHGQAFELLLAHPQIDVNVRYGDLFALFVAYLYNLNSVMFRRLLGRNDLQLGLANAKGVTVMHLICWTGDVNAAKLMLAHPNMTAAILGLRDYHGRTPFYIACREGHAELVTLLLRDGRSEVNAMAMAGDVPPPVGASHNNPSWGRYHHDCTQPDLLPRELRMRQLTYPACTPVQIARRHKHTPVVRLLAGRGENNIAKTFVEGEGKR